jgi:hypothetical protein
MFALLSFEMHRCTICFTNAHSGSDKDEGFFNCAVYAAAFSGCLARIWANKWDCCVQYREQKSQLNLVVFKCFFKLEGLSATYVHVAFLQRLLQGYCPLRRLFDIEVGALHSGLPSGFRHTDRSDYTHSFIFSTRSARSAGDSAGFTHLFSLSRSSSAPSRLLR